MKKNVHIIPHMHWDREWYFSDEESKILLINNMEEILELLESNEKYPYFLLDGQTAIIEDYLLFKPENKKRMKKLVTDGKLIIGPWYTQTDEMVVGGESIVRNLLYGHKDCLQFGNVMKIGYLPDSFGQSASMPQILNGFGIKHSVFWRGVSERVGTDKTEFYWKDDNDNKVLVQILPLGYAIGKYLPSDEKALMTRMDNYFSVLDKGASTKEIVMPNGHDQMPIQKNIFDIIKILENNYKDRQFFLSKYENLFSEIEKTPPLDTLKGEFLDGKYMRVHRSIYSTRADIKSSNTRIENKITNILEPLASIAYNLGFDYYSGYIESIWKEIMKNHAHDSIGCCCSDKVHQAISNRFFTSEEKTDSLIEYYKRKIVDAMEETITLDKLTAFNLLPYERNCVVEGEIITKMKNFILLDSNDNKVEFEIIDYEEVDAGLIDRQIVHYGNYDPFVKYILNFKDIIPSMGYKTYFIKEDSSAQLNICKKDNINTLENSHYIINIGKNGSLTIFDKKNNVNYENVMLVEDGGDDGDEYDYSPLKNDMLICSNDCEARVQITKHKYKSVGDISYTLKVPKDLISREQKKLDSSIDFNFNITLQNDCPIIMVVLEVNNSAKDHRVRLLIPNELQSAFSVSDNQFGVIKRSVVDEAMKVWEAENWKERPDSIYPMLSYVTLDNENAMSFLTNSVREFEIIGENYNTIAITIFRSVGFLGKEELIRRPGRPSGIKLATPDSQMIGENTYSFAFSAKQENMTRLAKEYLTPIVTYNKMPHNAMKLNSSLFKTPYEYSVFCEKNKQITLSAFKKSEYKNGFIVRYYNGTNKKVFATLDFTSGNMERTNLNEETLYSLDTVEDIPINYNEVQTYYISLLNRR
jgi:mannosylglycerate hydrolase